MNLDPLIRESILTKYKNLISKGGGIKVREAGGWIKALLKDQES